MALGGGIWLSQNKKIPGAYINFISRATASAALGDRGLVAMGLKMDWGKDGEIIELPVGDFIKNSLKIFGYDYSAPEMKGLRDLFKYASKAYFYKLNSASAGKATCTYATALYSGTCGNNLKIVIAKNADDNTKWDVTTLYNNVEVDVQTVSAASGLVDNEWVTFDTTATLAATAGTALTGGTTATVTAGNHQTFLEKIEPYAVNAVGVVNDDATEISSLNSLYSAWVKRMRDEVGVKCQVVCFNHAANYEGVVNVKNEVSDTGWSKASLVYWVTGVVAGTAVNASAMNIIYDGEFNVGASFTQAQLESFIDAGFFTLHTVNNDLRVLLDINSLTTVTADKGAIFKNNQTIRVIDEIANSIANIFNTKYLGRIPNDDDGRIALWNDIVEHHQALEDIRAIDNFDEKAVTVEQGNEKGAVLVNDEITVVNAMEKLYMTCIVA